MRLFACEGFRKRSANAIEFGRFAQHDDRTIRTEIWRDRAEFFSATAEDDAMAATDVGPAWSSLEGAWITTVSPMLEVATLAVPARTPFVSTGKLGRHSEHLGHLLTEMQYLQRTVPGGTW